MHHHAFQASRRNVTTSLLQIFSIGGLAQGAAGRAWMRRAQASSRSLAYTGACPKPTRITDPAAGTSTGFSALINDLCRSVKRDGLEAPGAPAEQTLLPASSVSLQLHAPPAIEKLKSKRRISSKRKHEPPHLYVSAHQLAAWQIDFIDQLLSRILPYDTFEDLEPLELLSSESLVYQDKTGHPLFNVGSPQTAAELYANLFGWTSSCYAPMPSFATLHAYHVKYHMHQSQRSFRILAEVAINEANFGAVRTLLREMDMKGILNDWHDFMWAIWVRWMVRRGKWGDAWQTVTQSIARGGQPGMPLELWKEFWGAAKPHALRHVVRDPYGNKMLRPLHLPFELYHDMGRYHVLMHNAPSLTEAEVKSVPPNLVYAVVRARLWSGKREWAMELTRDFFRNVQRGESPATQRRLKWCLKLLHLNLGLGWSKMGFPALRSMRQILTELLELNPRVKPNSDTLVLLLRPLKGTKFSGIHAVWLIKDFKARYGDSIENQKVRLRAASLAVKEGHPKLVRRMIARESAAQKVEVERSDLDSSRWVSLASRYTSMK